MSTGREVFQVEIRARDLARSIRFYGAVFAWKIYQSAPGYALVDTGRLPVVGILHDPRLPLGDAGRDQRLRHVCARQPYEWPG